MTDGNLRPIISNANRAWSLHYCGGKALAFAVADPRWTGMYRIAWPDGRVSDMANLSRICDAAALIVSYGPPRRDPRGLKWQRCETPANRVSVRSPDRGAPVQAPAHVHTR